MYLVYGKLTNDDVRKFRYSQLLFIFFVVKSQGLKYKDNNGGV